MGKFFSDFKKFISRGNIVDMAVGVIIATAFTAIVTALTSKIIMPFINWLLSLSGADGLMSAYTFLDKRYVLDDLGNPTDVVDLANSIYIDWGAFITAIINFILIALVLFIILRVMMNAQGFVRKAKGEMPTKEEKKQLKAEGVNMKNRAEVKKAIKELRERNKVVEEPKPTTDELLADILVELKKQNKTDEPKEAVDLDEQK